MLWLLVGDSETTVSVNFTVNVTWLFLSSIVYSTQVSKNANPQGFQATAYSESLSQSDMTWAAKSDHI